MEERIKEVTFIEQKLKTDYESLAEGAFEDRELFEFITRAKNDLLINPLCGTRIPERLIPKEYS